MEIVHLDRFRIPDSGPIYNTAATKDFYVHHARQNGDKRFFFVMNWIAPPLQAIVVAAVDPDADWIKDDKSPESVLWKRFLEMSNEERKQRIKITPILEEGPWLVKKALPRIPVILGTKVKMETFHEPGDHLEVAIDYSYSKADKITISLIMKAAKSVRASINTIIEATDQDELPERTLTCVRLGNLDLSRSPFPTLED